MKKTFISAIRLGFISLAAAGQASRAAPSLESTALFSQPKVRARYFVTDETAVVGEAGTLIYTCDENDPKDYLCFFSASGKFLKTTVSVTRRPDLRKLTGNRIATVQTRWENTHHDPLGPSDMMIMMMNSDGSSISSFVPKPDENSNKVFFRYAEPLSNGGLLVLTDLGKGYFLNSKAKVSKILNPLVSEFQNYEYLKPLSLLNGNVTLVSTKDAKVSFFDPKGNELKTTALSLVKPKEAFRLKNGDVLVSGEGGYAWFDANGSLKSSGDSGAWFEGGVCEFSDGSIAFQGGGGIRFLDADGQVVSTYPRSDRTDDSSHLLPLSDGSCAWAFSVHEDTFSVLAFDKSGNVTSKIIDGAPLKNNEIDFETLVPLSDGVFWAENDEMNDHRSVLIFRGGAIKSTDVPDSPILGHAFAKEKILLVHAGYDSLLIDYNGKTLATIRSDTSNGDSCRGASIKLDDRRFLRGTCMITVKGL